MTSPFRFNRTVIESVGYQLPPHVITSEDLEDRLEPLYRKLRLRKGQLAAITGISERRWWDKEFHMRSGAIQAAKKALAQTAILPNDIGMLIYGGVCRDYLEPATACAVADAIGVGPKALVYDVSNACLGVLNGMIQVANAIETGQIRAGMVVSCESARQIVELTIERMLASEDMEVFKHCLATLTGGSGAVALLLVRDDSGQKPKRLFGGVIRNDVSQHSLCTWGPDTGIPATQTMLMNTDSVNVLQYGVVLGTATYHDFQKAFLGGSDEPDKIICHQVGSAHQETILKALDICKEKDFSTYPYLGNIGTVSLPITLAIAQERGFLKTGDRVGLFGIGSGLNCLLVGVHW